MSRGTATSSVTVIPGQRRRGRGSEPATPLGSLTQREHRQVAACSECGSQRVTSLSMTLTDGTPVDFISCHHCEHRQWIRSDGDALSVDRVIEHTRKPA